VNIVVVGAGLAGLAAATWLRDRGHRVSVYERDTRPAGRAMTIRRPDGDDLVDVGTQYFHSNYRRGLALLRRTGLDAELHRIRGRTRFFDRRDPTATFTTGHRLPYIRAGTLWENVRLLTTGAARLARHPIDPYAVAAATRLDTTPAYAAVTDPFERAFNARTMIAAGALVEPDHVEVSYLQLIRLMRIIVMTDYLSAKRGIASLHEALADALPVHYGAAVDGLVAEPGRVTGVRLAAGGVVTADHVVLAVPTPDAAAILPTEWRDERAFLADVLHPPAVIVTLFLDGPLEPGVWSFVLDADPAGLVSFCVDAAEKNPAMVPSRRAALQAWICYPAAARAGELDDDALLAAVVAELEPLVPGLEGRVRHTHVRRIPRAVPQAPPGHDAAARRFLERIDARAGLSVCGDFLSGGYMEAALWSAERAVARLDAGA
jgi:protoporphyrinogen oxidase